MTTAPNPLDRPRSLCLVWLLSFIPSCCAVGIVLVQRQDLFSFRSIMIPQSAWKIARGAAAAILTLLGLALLAPSAAQASCGDYVMIGSQYSAHYSGTTANGHTDNADQ